VAGDRPYTTRLQAGESQDKSMFFESTVLDRYVGDPRYEARIGDYGGSISIRDEFDRDPEVPVDDKILVQSFGVATRPNGQRAIGVLLCYLADLTPRHQAHWKGSQIDEICEFLAPYVRNSVLGQPNDDISAYLAIPLLLEIINKQSVALGRRPLFHRTFRGKRFTDIEKREPREDREPPDDYHPILGPFSKSYLEFVSALDKMLSDNIDEAFFGQDVPLKDAYDHKKGTIQLLADWLVLQMGTSSRKEIRSLLRPMREVRSQRSTGPAHGLKKNTYDKTVFDSQAEVVMGTCEALIGLTKILSRLPGAEGVSIPEILSRIVVY
jgi:hypothetical protein